MNRRARTSVRASPAACAVALALFAVALVTATPRPAMACSCAPDPPAREALAEAGAVFTGTVVATRTVGRGAGEDLVARMRVDEVLEGEVARIVDVATPADGAMCGIGFAPGDRWLLYAGQRDDGSFSTYACTRTAALAYADERWQPSGQAERDLDELGPGSTPVSGEQLRDDPPPWGWIGAAVVIASAAAVVVTVIRVRRFG